MDRHSFITGMVIAVIGIGIILAVVAGVKVETISMGITWGHELEWSGLASGVLGLFMLGMGIYIAKTSVRDKHH